MNNDSEQIDFLAVLIYEHGENRYCEAPHMIRASHPEIAYHIALARGEVQRFGRRFVGLSHLKPAEEQVAPIACDQCGNAREHVCPKEQLAAFADPRWAGIQCTDVEIADALREPPLLVELDGLSGIPWHTLTHAYGPAVDVPGDLRRLASADPKLRQNACWQLGGSIYHQGTLYPATVYAIPFLIRLATEISLPDRTEIVRLLEAIAESCCIAPDRIRKAWAWRKKSFGKIYSDTTGQMAKQEITWRNASRSALLDGEQRLKSLATDNEKEIAKLGTIILKYLGIKSP